MMEIGAQLRRARESKGMSLEEVQQKTKIHAEYLKALENDQFDLLPSPFYVRAFLRTYAKCLELDPQSLLDRYERLNQGGAGPAARFRRTLPASHAGGYRNGTGSSQTVSPKNVNGEGPRVTSDSENPGQPTRPARPFHHTGTLRPSQNSGRFQTVKMNAVTGRERAVRGETSSPGSSRSSAVSQQTGRFRSGPQPVVRVEGQASLPQPWAGSRLPAPSQKPKEKKKGGLWIGAAFCAFLLICGVWYWVRGDASDSPQVQQNSGESGETVNGTASAQQTSVPELVLKEVDTGIPGDLYELSNADEIVLEVKSTQGESVFLYGENSDEPEEIYTMKLGDARVVKKDKFLWFRLTVPSAVQIQVNGVEIDTTAQDVAKSYRIQLKN